MTEPNESGLGFFLQSERERKGLTREHIAKVTRLRIHYIEALENEDWGKLPSPAFIKGFVKAYSKALGLDYKDVMGQFGSSIPVYDDLPKPLVPPKKIKNKNIILIIIVIFILFVFSAFFIKVPMYFLKRAERTSTKNTEIEAVQTQPHDQGPAHQVPPGDNLGHEAGSEGMPTEKDVESIGPAKAPEDITAGRTVIPTPGEGSPLKQIETPGGEIQAKYNLTGYVTSRTYIKIYVDHNPPKEYIFSPGSYPQWAGQEGFYIIVGNAAGIEFDFDGKRIKDLGDFGHVVRLRLPEDFDLDVDEN